MTVFRACSGLVIRCFKRVEHAADWLTGAAGPVFIFLCWTLTGLGGLSFCKSTPLIPVGCFPPCLIAFNAGGETLLRDLVLMLSRCRCKGLVNMANPPSQPDIRVDPSKHVRPVLPRHTYPTRLSVASSIDEVTYANAHRQ